MCCFAVLLDRASMLVDSGGVVELQCESCTQPNASNTFKDGWVLSHQQQTKMCQKKKKPHNNKEKKKKVVSMLLAAMLT